VGPLGVVALADAPSAPSALGATAAVFPSVASSPIAAAAASFPGGAGNRDRHLDRLARTPWYLTMFA
jgi:hypothetical protein